MTEWQRIPSEVDTTKAPFDGDDVLIYANSASVDVVRLAWWDNGDDGGFGGPEDRGWWSAKHSVTSEHISDAPGCNWSHWTPFSAPVGGPDCDHQWIELTTFEDKDKRFICLHCEARKTEPQITA